MSLTRILSAIAALSLGVPAPLSAQPATGGVALPATGPALDLREAVALASGDQPSLEAYAREAAASEEAAIAARSLPDPQLTLGIQNYPILRGDNAFSPTGEMMTMYTIGVMREQVRRSKREAQAAEIRAEALVSRRRATAEQRRIVRDVMIAWIDSVEARSKQRLLERLIADLQTGRAAIAAGVPTGAAQPSLALEADAEIALARTKLAAEAAAEARARARLARWIGPAASRPLPQSLPSIEAPAAIPAHLFRLASHPELRTAEAEQQAALYRVEVAEEEKKPDISWSVMLGVRPEYGEMISGQVSIPLQINRAGRQDRQVLEARARADAARLRAEDVRRALERDYRAALAAYDGAGRELESITKKAIPALEAAFDSAEARYAGGGGTLERPLDIVRRYIEATLESIETRAKRNRAAADLVYLLGEAGQ